MSSSVYTNYFDELPTELDERELEFTVRIYFAALLAEDIPYFITMNCFNQIKYYLIDC
jgi:hypothetical protein